MPVSRSDYERGSTPGSTESKIVEFLEANYGNAYTADEIAFAIGHPVSLPPSPGATDLDRLGKAVDKAAFVSQLGLMVLMRKISSRLVRTSTGSSAYFAAHKRR